MVVVGVANTCHCHFTPGKETRYALYWRLCGPQGFSGQLQKISHVPGFNPDTDQAVASHYNDYAFLAHDLYVFKFWDMECDVHGPQILGQCTILDAALQAGKVRDYRNSATDVSGLLACDVVSGLAVPDV